ncbi:LIM zinc-binding domain-containing protein [Caenorhabditis elegans]|nr:LIM zinc-binding domain-containing protein [Caenorhabditis elegans]ABO31113.1 LIM-9 isoform [Caenorhabditis elegans]CAJ30229.2 LIM zinc-binding domain-containing protein [Caenorhabditis elegans]|eukprot:NP_001021410.2 LIM domain family [Caenorhabditis elegans]
MMLSTMNNPYRGGGNNNSNNNNSNHGMVIEDVTDDPEYSSYGNENEKPENEEEGAFVEYEKLDKTEDPAAFKVCQATTAVNRTYNNIRPSYRMPIGGGSGSSSGSISREIRIESMNLTDVEDGARCRDKECHLGWKQHPWRKVCVHCKSDRSDHELPPNQALNVYNRLGIQPPAGMPQSGVAEPEVPGSVGHGYAWVPPGLSRKKVEEYMSQLPNNVVPRTNSNGEKLREKQLLLQLPRQDLSVAYCRHLTSQTERKVYEEFVNARNEIALDIGYVSSNINKAMECHKCSGILETNEMAVIAPKLGDSTGWHPACFTCQACEQLLVDLTYCVKDNQIYCERHYAELHKPRCSACDELIFAGEYTKAMNKDWHSDHFCCWQCDQTLTGQRYIMRDEQPYCIKCYEDVFANQCDECAKPIGIDSKDLSYKDKHWHEHCFLCSMCKISLVDMPFGSKNDRIFCSNCYDQAFATRCDGCNEIFRAGMKKMEYKGKQWHDKCFCCAHCKLAIGTKSFIPKNDDVFCGPCYEEKFATRCSKCKKVITAGGVTYKNEPWHRECFCCTNCNSSLAGQRFTSKDEKPYCANCYGDLFAKRCNACTKPITGIGGAKFISFEDRHWHNDCFICAQCTTSLVGKGFITDGHEILCPECAKARLMAANS